jgi:GNAT superfamily N-acetyltransferase
VVVHVRLMTAGDVERVAALSTELGYPSTPADVAGRFAEIAARHDHAALVGETDSGEVVGWVHVHASLTLEAAPAAEIGGLVVHEPARAHGVGKLLVVAAERWAAEHGYAEMRVRSNVVREAAHQFYRRLGYEVVKTQLNFRKRL